MAGHRGHIAVLLVASFGICACEKQMAPAAAEPIHQIPTSSSQGTLDFLGGIYSQPYVIAMSDIYSTGSVQPFATKNDEFGDLTTFVPSGLETLTSRLASRSLHSGRQNRDTRIADFNNDGFADLISNTYDCVDLLH